MDDQECGWVMYLHDGGLDRPVSAVPFALIDFSTHERVMQAGKDSVTNQSFGPLADLFNREDADVIPFYCLAITVGSCMRMLDDGLDPEFPNEPGAFAKNLAYLGDFVGGKILKNIVEMLISLGLWHADVIRPVNPALPLRSMILEFPSCEWVVADPTHT